MKVYIVIHSPDPYHDEGTQIESVWLDEIKAESHRKRKNDEYIKDYGGTPGETYYSYCEMIVSG